MINSEYGKVGIQYAGVTRDSRVGREEYIQYAGVTWDSAVGTEKHGYTVCRCNSGLNSGYRRAWVYSMQV